LVVDCPPDKKSQSRRSPGILMQRNATLTTP
jgi:hypothetical protein